MSTGAHFESLEDVERYFDLRSELVPTPTPPADLWERLDQQWRQAQKSATSLRLPVPSPKSLAINFYPPVRRRKSYALKPVKRIRTGIAAGKRTRKARYSLRAPLSWKDLL